MLHPFNELLVSPSLPDVNRHHHALVGFLGLLAALDPASEYLKLVVDELDDQSEKVLIGQAPARLHLLVVVAARLGCPGVPPVIPPSGVGPLR